MNDKADIRAEYKKTRLAMSRVIIEKHSSTICRRLLDEIDWRTLKSLHRYQPMTWLNEVDLTSLMSVIKRKYPGMEAANVAPTKDEPLPLRRFDLIIVPVLAFDKAKHRLGWGGGWYDRFLTNQPQALKIGLCFENGLSKALLPREPHDITLDKIITEKNIY